MKIDWKNSRYRTWLIVAFALVYPFPMAPLFRIVIKPSARLPSDISEMWQPIATVFVMFLPVLAAFCWLPLDSRLKTMVRKPLAITILSIAYLWSAAVFSLYAEKPHHDERHTWTECTNLDYWLYTVTLRDTNKACNGMINEHRLEMIKEGPTFQ